MAVSFEEADERAIAATRYCDFGHPEIHRLARRVFVDTDSDLDVALAAFRHVRDQVVFGLDLWQVTASQTLRKGHGMCSNKALLFAALLRHQGIPARLAWVPMHPISLAPALGTAARLMGKHVNHVIAEVCMDGTWLAVDLTLDRATYDGLFRPRGVDWDIEWNGRDDCLLFREHLTGPVVSCPDIDATLATNAGNRAPPRLAAAPVLRLVNEVTWRKVSRARR